ncbi:hypothetical protein M0R45_030274 [Rubus argutus]|uniref:NB-ARC domain-containing protein n=1 Tax=Rubus argutus TaxID=59490 RepID=A0AAW1WBD3_RUBAR
MAHSAIPTSGVIGRDSDKKVIVDLLMQQTVDNQSGNSQSIVSVIPIVGIGGLGKTTLAKSVYDESKDVGHFELRMWVHVSVDFDSHRLMAKILSSALDKKISDDELSVVQLQDKLRAALKDKRFFLVLDDVWNEDRLKWTDLRDVLIEGAKLGSEENQHSHLFEIGKKIVEKCGGLPLVVKTLGSQLYSKTDEREWKLVRDSELWELEREGEGHILPALRLSYSQLPSYLKPCLAYCAYLRKGEYIFSSRELILCWMAHGILQSRDHENLEMEDIGEQYFKDIGEQYFKELCARSFFENVQLVDEFDPYYKFSIHDLIYDLVRSIEQDCSNLFSLPRETSYLAALRVLILGNCKQLDLVNQHDQGISLRLEKLSLSDLPQITKLPEWLQGAANTLQDLDIENCSNLEGMDRLTALRDLKIKDCTELQRRCKRDTGEDWPKIAHIPNLSIF